MSIEVVLAVAGIALLVYSILGRKIKRVEAKEYRIVTDPLDKWQRIVLSILGVLFIGIAIIPSFEKMPTVSGADVTPTSNPTLTSTPMPTLTSTATVTVTAMSTSTPIIVSMTPSFTPTNTNEMLLFKGCISDEHWTPYRRESQIIDENNCWELPGISAQDNGLQMYLRSDTLFGTYGISTNINKNSIVEFDFNIEELTVSPNEIISNISFGLVPQSSIDPSGGLVFLLQVENIYQDFVYLKYREPGQINSNYLQPHYNFGENHHVKIEITDLFLSISINGDKHITEPISIPFRDYVFWIGYQIPNGANLSANISNFSVVNP